ncbi:hypothetical protein KC332_g40 [Hortaea werneckii]|nr:hypothetical protein KC332_g40 [Hortaea werneckii]
MATASLTPKSTCPVNFLRHCTKYAVCSSSVAKVARVAAGGPRPRLVRSGMMRAAWASTSIYHIGVNSILLRHLPPPFANQSSY